MPDITLQTQTAGDPISTTIYNDNLYKPVAPASTENSLSIVNGRLDSNNLTPTVGNMTLTADKFLEGTNWRAWEVSALRNLDYFGELFAGRDFTEDSKPQPEDQPYLCLPGLTLDFKLPWDASAVLVGWQVRGSAGFIGDVSADTPGTLDYGRMRLFQGDSRELASPVYGRSQRCPNSHVGTDHETREGLVRQRIWTGQHIFAGLSKGLQHVSIRVIVYPKAQMLRVGTRKLCVVAFR